jgi:serine protease
MPRVATVLLLLGLGYCLTLGRAEAGGAGGEYNPVRRNPVSIGPEAARLIVGFRTTPANAVTHTVKSRLKAQSFKVTQANTGPADVAGLVLRTGLDMAKSRQLTPSMHLVFLRKTLYGADVQTALGKLRADSAVQFAAVDQRRYPQSAPVVPNDPLFIPTPPPDSPPAGGQWYMLAPNPSVIVEGVTTADLSATDAVDAWSITTGSAGIVIADVDTGVLFNHPDLLRAGLGGRLLPGYDFVGQDYNPDSPYNALGTYLIANDGDGWDPDPSDPGDWISSTDTQNVLFANDQVEPSSWHGTRVVGIFGALTNNDVGIAGMTWGSWILPVRALGKGGGYDSDIISGVEWAAGLPVTNPDGPAVPTNPYPADIINLSLGGGTDSCSDPDGAAYESAFTTVTGLGVLVVIAAGNASGAVELPGNCSTVVPGVMAVAGLRNVGTKVGYSSFGPQVSVSAPAGNCVNSSGDCLRSIDTTTDLGTTGPLSGSNYTYTNELNPNLGTSFATPIVSGIAALMRSVNDNLTPAQLAARIEASATAFPANTGNIPVCPNLDTADGSDQCSCPASGQCGSGMVNAYSAVQAAQAPIAAVALPAIVGGSAVLDGSGSAAACGRTIASYSWAAGGGVSVLSGNTSAKATIQPGTGTVTLTVTDNMGATDTATVNVTSSSATSSAPSTAGNSACPTSLVIAPAAPTVSQAFSPASVGETILSTLTITLNNANGYALTQTNFSYTVPGGLVIASSPVPATTCTAAHETLTASSGTVTLSDADVPADGSCTITLGVSAGAAGVYTSTIAANSVSTGPAGSNTAASSAALTVTVPNAPTVAQAFAPASITQNGASTLTITLNNSNAFALTRSALTDTLPGNVTIMSSPAAATTCGGSLSAPSGSAVLSGGTIPANGSCTVTLTVTSAVVGSYTNTIAAGALSTSPAGGNAAAVHAALTVSAPGKSSGGALDWLDMLFLAGVALAGLRIRPSAA